MENSCFTDEEYEDVSELKKVTVLYKDGTLILDEEEVDRENNIGVHGRVKKEYSSFQEYVNIFNNENDVVPWEKEKKKIKYVKLGSVIKPSTISYWLSGLENVKEIDLTLLDTSNATDLSGLFYESAKYSRKITIIGLDKLDVTKVKYMNDMFYNVGRNAKICSIGDLSGWNVCKVRDMSGMFRDYCKKSSVFDIGDLTEWNTQNVTDMHNMFNGCASRAIKFSIGNIGNWNVKRVIDMSNMFMDCAKKAKSWDIGDLSEWDISECMDMRYMFYNAGKRDKSFNIGDLSKWSEMTMRTDVRNMFNHRDYETAPKPSKMYMRESL